MKEQNPPLRFLRLLAVKQLIFFYLETYLLSKEIETQRKEMELEKR